ncbi:hypothetical protein G7Z17_g3123 [Cylindrodendrum hubeiense]|uniref:Ankyrin repeat protein n=1 Tax=Cylindrodendrum hubeiense TaxID=595255 RepID=A0A9P5HGF9_9HYPO|nr:hypothetical protein G7Z17_g3123 [Cylindrodendrum hubeiense]
MLATSYLGFLIAVSLIQSVAADTGDEFSNNLFSDLAPLLALFGERVTMQFMSQSMGWADNVILAMAPLGIITAIVSAIRVGGPSWLKALVGRARENLAVAEADLMSSTSGEVCELWNGQEVVRCMGSAEVVELICLLPEDMQRMESSSDVPKIVTRELKEVLELSVQVDFKQWCLCGFIVQFVGLRGMHFSASIAQLIAVVLMSCLRAWVRRGLAMPPQSKSLIPGFELEWFTTALRDLGSATWPDNSSSDNAIKDWRIVTGGTQTYETLELASESEESEAREIHDSEAHKMMTIRRGLGKLVRWRGPPSQEAILLARAIEITMDTIFSHSSTAVWQFEARSTQSDAQSIYVHLQRQTGNWRVRLDEIEAVLSLWLYSVNKEENIRYQEQPEGQMVEEILPSDDDRDPWPRIEGSLAKRSLRILGTATRAIYRDLQWWIPRDMSGIIGAEKDEEGTLVVANHRVIGGLSPEMTSATSDNGSHKYRSRELEALNIDEAGKLVDEEEKSYTLLATESYDPLKLVYARNMFSSFMRAAAKVLPAPIEGGADIIRHSDINSTNSWQQFTLRNGRLLKLAQDIHSTGLGSPDQIYLSIIPPLSVEQKLPQADAIIELAQQHAKQYEERQHWKEASDVYLWLFRIAKTFQEQIDITAGPIVNTFSEHSRIATRATAILLEFLRILIVTIELRKDQQYGEMNMRGLEELKIALQKELKASNQETLTILFRLYKSQGRPWSHDLVEEDESIEQEIEFTGGESESTGGESESIEEHTIYPSTFNFTELHQITQSGYEWEMKRHLEHGNDPSPKDIHDWTPLHYAAATKSAKLARTLLENRADVNARDLIEWTPLHYACQRGDNSIVLDIIRQGAERDARGKDGLTPLHCAVMNGHIDVVCSLIEAGATADILDASGNTPLLSAAYRGHKGVIQYLWQVVNKRLRNNKGRTVLHLAAMAGKSDVVEWLVNPGTDKSEGADKDAKDADGSTPLHGAARHGHTDTVTVLCPERLRGERERA